MARATQTPVHIVWFKRDLRVDDHAPLIEAARRGPVLPLYIVEPSLLRAPDYAARHWTFVQSSLTGLRKALSELGQPLVIRIGEAVQTFDMLRRQLPITSIWAHEETGSALTWQRDIALRDWARTNGIPLVEMPHNGIGRGLQNRDGWVKAWRKAMRATSLPPPEQLEPTTVVPGRIPDAQQLRLARDRCVVPRGGSHAAHAVLHSFLTDKVRDYRGVLSADNHSHLSPHLAYGTISLRAVVQATRAQIRAVKREAHSAENKHTIRNLNAFLDNLLLRSDCVQQLESEPRIEFETMLPALDGLRHADNHLFTAWAAGETGYPLLDAGMRELVATGSADYRIRAALVSFAAYDLWLDWRAPALHLARLFVDYDAGIHYPQMQRQSGTTGLHPIQVQNPTVLAQKTDPSGSYIRHWLPELASIPDAFIHQPWQMPASTQKQSDCILGSDYQRPIVDHSRVATAAHTRLHRALQTPEAIAQTQSARARHGSKPSSSTSKPKRHPAPHRQLQMDLDV
jgi:deoxyribodipyrimidine photo-lyase